MLEAVKLLRQQLDDLLCDAEDSDLEESSELVRLFEEADENLREAETILWELSR